MPIFTLSLIITCILSLSISTFTIIHVIHYREVYGTKLIVFLNIVAILNSGIIFSTLYLFSVLIYSSEIVNLMSWKLLVISGAFSLQIVSLIHYFFKEYMKIQIFPFLIFTVLLGLLIGNLFSPDSIQIEISPVNATPFIITDLSSINFYFNGIITLILTIYYVSIIIYSLYISIYVYYNARSKELGKDFLRYTLIFIVHLIMFILYLFFQLTIFRELYMIFFWINTFIVCLMLIKKPESFLVITNKIYFINIYHKSGVLLYSFKFKYINKTDSAIWGNILIGINHILSEFIDKTDKIDVLQTKKVDIIVNYDELGFATLIITNKKNAFLENLMHNFTMDFKKKYKNELNDIQDLNRLIDISDFKGTLSLIKKHFQIYFLE